MCRPHGALHPASREPSAGVVAGLHARCRAAKLVQKNEKVRTLCRVHVITTQHEISVGLTPLPQHRLSLEVGMTLTLHLTLTLDLILDRS